MESMYAQMAAFPLPSIAELVYVLQTAARAVVPMALVLGSLAIALKALETKVA